MEMYQPLLAFNWNLLFSAVTVLVLFLVLKHFFFEKVHNFMKEREKAVESALKNAADVNVEAQKKLENYESQLANAEKESREIIKAARDQAKVQAESILEEADLKANKIIEQSHKNIKRDKIQARKELRDEVSSLALIAAGKIMEKELNPEEHEEIINRILKDAEDEPWN